MTGIFVKSGIAHVVMWMRDEIIPTVSWLLQHDVTANAIVMSINITLLIKQTIGGRRKCFYSEFHALRDHQTTVMKYYLYT